MKPDELDIKSAVGLITLMRLRGIGTATAEKLAERFDTLAEVIEASQRKLGGIRPIASGDATIAMDAARKDADQMSQAGIAALSIFDTDYPEAYRSIPDRPPIIYYKGNIGAIGRSVACIGTREPSEFGYAVAERVVEALVKDDWVIVSGLAIGVDTLCHEAALRYGGRTIAIMAGGLDGVYPKRNAGLAQQIIERDGALISEQPLGTPPAPFNLVQRDRLQSGLAAGTFVVQTDVKGGSMHTVRFTLMQGRRLIAPIPTGRHAAEPKSQGILAITSMSGPKFAEAVKATGDYAKLLNGTFHDRAPALGVAGSQDYEKMLNELQKSTERAFPLPQHRQLAML